MYLAPRHRAGDILLRIGPIACAVIVALELFRGIAAAAPQPVATDRIEGVTVQFLVEGGKLLLGANDIFLELRPTARPSPDVKDVILTAARPDAPACGYGALPARLTLAGLSGVPGSRSFPSALRFVNLRPGRL